MSKNNPKISTPEQRDEDRLIGVLDELRSQRSLLEQISLDQRKTRKLLQKLKGYNMALPEIIENAVKTEIEEGNKLQVEVGILGAQVAELKAIIARTPTPGVGEIIVNLEELTARISSINPTPVSDAIVAEVISNEAIETPVEVQEAPPVAVDVIQSEPVVTEALDAIVAFDEAESDAE